MQDYIGSSPTFKSGDLFFFPQIFRGIKQCRQCKQKPEASLQHLEACIS